MAHADGVHAADERLRGEGIVLGGRLHVVPVEIRVLELANGIMDGLHRWCLKESENSTK
jgi:hypothetical protein